jgi:ATP-dependent Clp protease ATP-binding subunit ClpC
MPKINVYLPDELADAVRDAQVPVSAICQTALEHAVREVSALRGSEEVPTIEPSHGPFTRFTPRARKAIACAQDEARDLRHRAVGTEHLLLGVLDEGGNLALKVLEALEVEPDDLRSELTASMDGPSEDARGRTRFTPLSKKALELSMKESVRLGHNYIGCEHLLLGLVATEEGLAGRVLQRMGVELSTTRRTVVTALAGHLRQRGQEWSRPAAGPTAPSDATPSVLEEILRRLDNIERRLAS